MARLARSDLIKKANKRSMRMKVKKIAANVASAMRASKAIYFLIFALGGSVVPFISLYFQQHGLKKDEIGYIYSVAAIAVVLSPILLTYLADSRIDARKILAAAMLFAAAALGALYLSRGFVATLLIYTLHYLAYIPLSTLTDGITFGVM